MAFMAHCDNPTCKNAVEVDDEKYLDWIDISAGFVADQMAVDEMGGESGAIQVQACSKAHAVAALRSQIELLAQPGIPADPPPKPDIEGHTPPKAPAEKKAVKEKQGKVQSDVKQASKQPAIPR